MIEMFWYKHETEGNRTLMKFRFLPTLVATFLITGFCNFCGLKLFTYNKGVEWNINWTSLLFQETTFSALVLYIIIYTILDPYRVEILSVGSLDYGESNEPKAIERVPTEYVQLVDYLEEIHITKPTQLEALIKLRAREMNASETLKLDEALNRLAVTKGCDEQAIDHRSIFQLILMIQKHWVGKRTDSNYNQALSDLIEYSQGFEEFYSKRGLDTPQKKGECLVRMLEGIAVNRGQRFEIKSVFTNIDNIQVRM